MKTTKVYSIVASVLKTGNTFEIGTYFFDLGDAQDHIDVCNKIHGAVMWHNVKEITVCGSLPEEKKHDISFSSEEYNAITRNKDLLDLWYGRTDKKCNFEEFIHEHFVLWRHPNTLILVSRDLKYANDIKVQLPQKQEEQQKFSSEERAALYNNMVLYDLWWNHDASSSLSFDDYVLQNFKVYRQVTGVIRLIAKDDKICNFTIITQPSQNTEQAKQTEITFSRQELKQISERAALMNRLMAPWPLKLDHLEAHVLKHFTVERFRDHLVLTAKNSPNVAFQVLT